MTTARGVLVGTLLLLSASCSATAKSAYAPTTAPVYEQKRQGTVTLAGVSDSRGMDRTAYLKSFQHWDSGEYDRPVVDIVRDALQTELSRSGIAILNTPAASSGFPKLNVDVLDYSARLTRAPFTSDTLELQIRLKFTWTDPDGRVAEENERSERATRELGMSAAPIMPTGAAGIRSYGDELMNALLPKVIEKEIRKSKVIAPAPPTEPTPALPSRPADKKGKGAPAPGKK